MEEKYPIRFSLGQFILLLGVEVIVLALVFLLGARFGGSLLNPNGAPAVASGNYQSLDPQQGASPSRPAPKAESKLSDPVEPEEAVTEEGEEGMQEPLKRAGRQEGEHLSTNKSLLASALDKNTVVRFKSGDHAKFAVEVGQFFDEVLASHEINKLKKKGLDAYLVIAEGRSGAPVYGVRMGSFSDRTLAEQYAAKVSNEQGLELRVVQVN